MPQGPQHDRMHQASDSTTCFVGSSRPFPDFRPQDCLYNYCDTWIGLAQNDWTLHYTHPTCVCDTVLEPKVLKCLPARQAHPHREQQLLQMGSWSIAIFHVQLHIHPSPHKMNSKIIKPFKRSAKRRKRLRPHPLGR